MNKKSTRKRNGPSAKKAPKKIVTRAFELAPVAIATTDIQGKFIDANQKFLELSGFTAKEIQKLNFSYLTASVNRHVNLPAFEAMVASGQDIYRNEKRFRRKDGSVFLARLTANLCRDQKGKPIYYIATFEPVSDGKDAEVNLRRINRLYSILVRANETIFLNADRVNLMQRVCDLLVQEGDLCLAYIVRHSAETDHFAALVASGVSLSELAAINLAASKGEHSKGPIAIAIKTGRPEVSNDIASDVRMKPWREIAMRKQCKSTVAIPIAVEQKCHLALVLGARVKDYFGYDEVDLLMLVAKNLSFTFENIARDAASALADRQYKESEQRFRQLAEHIDEVFWLLDSASDKIIYVNSAFEKVWARPVESILSTRKVWLDSIHPDDKLRVMTDFLSPKINTSFEIEYRILRPDGTVRWIHDRTFPIRNKQGDVQRVAGIARDVTERHQTQATLVSVHDRLYSLLENLTDGYHELNKNFEFVYCNAQYERMFQKDRNLIIGKSIWDEFTGLAETSFAVALRRAMETGKIEIFEDFYAPLKAWYEIRIYPSENGLSVFVRDMTDLHELSFSLMRERARLVHAQSVAKIGSWETNLQTLRVEWSEETYSIFGIDPLTYQPTHTSFLEFVHPDDRDVVDNAFRDSFGSNGAQKISHRILTPDGREKFVEETWEVFRDTEGQPVKAVGTCQDITDKHLAAAEKRRLGERLISTLESITDAFMLIDRNWNFSYLNLQAEKLLQRRRSDLLGKNVWQSFPGVEDADFGYQYKYAMRSGESVAFESFYEPLRMWVEVRAFPSDQGLAVYFRDTGAEVAARQKLVASEARFRELAENIQEIFYVLNPENGYITYISPAYEKVWGRRCEDLLANPLSYLDAVHPDERSLVETSLADRRAGKAVDIEYRILRPDDAVRWIRDFSYPIFDEAGRLDHIIGVSHDISERKLADQRLREQASLLDKASDAIIVRDLDHRIRYWNKGAEKMYGWAEHEVLGKSIRELLYSDYAAYDAAIAEMIKNGEWNGDIEQRTRDGRVLIVEGRWTLVRDARGVPQSVLAINGDVTERRTFERHLLRAQRLESIGTLAGGIAHDLNNILTPILLASEIMRGNLHDKDSLELLDTIQVSSQRGADMVSQILSFARGNDGEKTTTNIEPLLAGIEKIVRDTFPKNIELTVDLDSRAAKIEADSTQLHQVLLNLCVNARDAMPTGGRLIIATQLVDVDEHFAAMVPGATPATYVLIEVADTGVGMPDSVLEHIFDPFYTTKDVGRGTGLGLSTSLKIIQNHNGFIQVESIAGKGSIFKVYLPVGKKAAEPQVSATSEQGMIRGNGELILVVDDEEPIRKITQQMLEEFGYRVCTATDGADGLVKYAERRSEIRVILSDMMMPALDGSSFIQIIRRMDAQLPVIISSGVANEATLTKLSELGVVDFLQKPFTTERLLKVLQRACSHTPKF
ncbi:PAS domain S-box protein [Turneriella parva]|uniref:histidine kinase n=1 Tax=Turneriella parva (strain ATCC BAA-1111 / DSM 21527 / NCTC 11395 / H) TaxID=869212 RepID=I4B3D8_TURPD|nr:PAS domain S-box protein [Turneriella parva]AFM11795.1 signal transduction histidine kinase, nitrogen specific, NtrB [Turneriella parva DSM 21527]